MPNEYPEDDSRTAPFQSPASESALRRAPESKTRYVDLPPSPENSAAQRNLAWAVILTVVALCALRFALMIPGYNAVRTVVACLGTFGLIALFYNLRILRQRNGVFLALAVVILFGAAMPLVERGFTSLDRLARERLSDEDRPAKVDVAPPPPPTARNVPPAPVTPELPPALEEKEKPSGKPPGDDVVRELAVPPPPATAKKIIEITDDVEVKISGRPFLVKKGNTFEFVSMQDGMTTFKAGDQTLSVSSDFTILKIDYAERYASAQKEAVRLYPGLAEKFSEQHDLFLEASRDLLDTLPDFRKSPEWPLRLAEQLAAAHGWKSTKDLEEEARKANSEPPDEADPKPAAPPDEPDVPQENPLPPIPDEKR